MTITSTPAPGYYLLDSGVPISFTPTASPFAIILDERGVPVWYRRVSPAVIDVHADSEGRIVWGQFSSPGFGTNPALGYEVRELDGTFVKLWRTVGAPTDYHDIVELPGWGPSDDRVRHSTRHRGPDVTGPAEESDHVYTANEQIVDSIVQRVRPDDSVAWTWNSADHIDEIAETTFPMWFPFCACADLVHVNAIDVTPAGDVLVSARNLDSVLVVRDPGAVGDPTAGEIIARYGGQLSTVTFNDPPYGGYACPARRPPPAERQPARVRRSDPGRLFSRHRERPSGRVPDRRQRADSREPT